MRGEYAQSEPLSDTELPLRRFAAILLLAAVYFAGAKLGLRFAFVNQSATAIWPPTGIAIAALILFGYRLWPGIFIGAFLANLTTAGAVMSSLGIAAGNTVEGLFAAYLINILAGGENAFGRPKNILKFGLFSILAAGVSATVGTTVLGLAGLAAWMNFGPVWFTWLLGDLGGALIVAPLIILWAKKPYPLVNWRRIAEAVAAFAVLGAVSLFVFGQLSPLGTKNYPVAFLVLPVLVWIAVRFSQRETSLAIFALAVIATYGDLNGYGPFAPAGPVKSMFMLQAFIGIMALTAHVLASVQAGHKNTEKALNESNRVKDEFLAVLAHELRNPLAPALTYLELIKLRGMDDPELGEAVGGIHKSIKNMARLLDDLLDISRVNQGKIRLQKKVVELQEILVNAVASTKAMFESRGHALTVSIPEAPLMVMGDPLRLEQIVVNLLNNAAKYTKPGGQVWLTCDLKEDKAVISVKDTGVGIEPSALPGVFEMFSQVDQSITRSQGGLGVGLKLVKTLLEMHGGTIEGRSEGLGKGSEFIATLPVAPAHEAVSVKNVSLPEELVPSGARKGRKVLIVDDNRAAADAMAWVLRQLGHETAVVYESGEAMEAVRGFAPEAILLDIGMPGLSGYEVAKRLRAEVPSGNLTIAAVTGYGQKEDRERAAAAGFDHHFVKPVDIASVQKVLEALG